MGGLWTPPFGAEPQWQSAGRASECRSLDTSLPSIIECKFTDDFLAILDLIPHTSALLRSPSFQQSLVLGDTLSIFTPSESGTLYQEANIQCLLPSPLTPSFAHYSIHLQFCSRWRLCRLRKRRACLALTLSGSRLLETLCISISLRIVFL